MVKAAQNCEAYRKAFPKGPPYFTFATSYGLVVASMLVLGFFLMSLAPIGYQYAAEITFPTPEGTSNGLIQLFGQASVVFVYIMEALKSPEENVRLAREFTPITQAQMASLAEKSQPVARDALFFRRWS